MLSSNHLKTFLFAIHCCDLNDNFLKENVEKAINKFGYKLVVEKMPWFQKEEKLPLIKKLWDIIETSPKEIKNKFIEGLLVLDTNKEALEYIIFNAKDTQVIAEYFIRNKRNLKAQMFFFGKTSNAFDAITEKLCPPGGVFHSSEFTFYKNLGRGILDAIRFSKEGTQVVFRDAMREWD